VKKLDKRDMIGSLDEMLDSFDTKYEQLKLGLMNDVLSTNLKDERKALLDAFFGNLQD
jgi:hypothetical protein